MDKNVEMRTVAQVAEMYNISQYFVRKLALSGKIKATRVGSGKGKVLINVDSVDEYFRTCCLTDEIKDAESDGIQQIII